MSETEPTGREKKIPNIPVLLARAVLRNMNQHRRATALAIVGLAFVTTDLVEKQFYDMSPRSHLTQDALNAKTNLISKQSNTTSTCDNVYMTFYPGVKVYSYPEIINKSSLPLPLSLTESAPGDVAYTVPKGQVLRLRQPVDLTADYPGWIEFVPTDSDAAANKNVYPLRQTANNLSKTVNQPEFIYLGGVKAQQTKTHHTYYDTRPIHKNGYTSTLPCELRYTGGLSIVGPGNDEAAYGFSFNLGELKAIENSQSAH